jgi:hypothetical protein
LFKSGTLSKHKFLVALIFVDIGFLFLAFLNKYTIYFNDWRFALTYDWSYAEIYQYIKEVYIAAAFFLLAYFRKFPGYLVWSGLFFYFFLDDAFQFHETVGGLIANNLNFETMFGLRAQDFGELIIYACVGLIFFCFGILSYLRCDDYHKKVWRTLLGLVVLLVFVGVGLDMLHQVIDSSGTSIGIFRIGSLIGAMEDFGEMIVMSLCAWYTTVVYKKEEFYQGELHQSA